METKHIAIAAFLILILVLGLYYAGKSLEGLETGLKQSQTNKPSASEMVRKIEEIKLKTDEAQRNQQALLEDNNL